MQALESLKACITMHGIQKCGFGNGYLAVMDVSNKLVLRHNYDLNSNY